MSLQDKAVLVRLSMGQWGARKLDKRISHDAADAAGCGQEWVRAWKTLVDPASLKPINDVQVEARTYHYGVTCPWDDHGGRILPNALYLEYVQRMGESKAKQASLVGALASQYSYLRAEAKRVLNGAFSEADYPPDISVKYHFDLEIRPVPSASDIRVDVSDDELARLRSEVESGIQEQLRGAMSDLWRRLREVVGAVATQLPKYDKGQIKRFHDTLVGNIRETCRILPKLNITDDPDLNSLAAQVQADLCKWSPADLRANKVVRAQVATKASDLLSRIDSLKGVIA